MDTSARPVALQTEAPAKLNLSLDVLRKRDDGFHEIRSLVIGIGLTDLVHCSVTTKGRAAITCSNVELESDGNLAVVAVTALADHLGRDNTVAIRVDKKIPIASGLGGGSSDAAAALRLCNELWRSQLSDHELRAIGAGIGSDVPLFFSLPAARLTGRGELAEPVALNWSGHVLIAHAQIPVATGPVYAAWRPGDGRGVGGDSVEQMLTARSGEQINELCHNDLLESVFRLAPQVRAVHAKLDAMGCGRWNATGAGATFFRLYDEPAAANNAAERMRRAGLDIQTVVVQAPVSVPPIMNNEDEGV